MQGVSGQSKRKACARCVIAKAKCSFSNEQHICDRCRRLRRACVLEETPRRRTEKQSTRVKALEDKVNSILTLLHPPQSADLNGDASVNAPMAPSPPRTEYEASSTARPQTDVQGFSDTTSLTMKDSSRFDVVENGILSMAAADTLLKKYKEVYSKTFPFVFVAPDNDASTLRTNSPFLFLAIMTTCYEGDHMMQRRLGLEMAKILSERTLVSNERDLDLLQGLLVRLSWHHLHFNPIQKHSSMLLQLAIGLVTDLDLDRCPAHRDQRVGSVLCYDPNKTGQAAALPAQCRRSTAEIRALLGCFYLSSAMATTRKELAMRQTKWIDHCCDVLDFEPETSSDTYAVAFIRARCMARQISERLSYEDHTTIQFQSDEVVQMSLDGFKSEIEALETRILSSTQDNYALLLEIKMLRIVLYEVGLYRIQTRAPPSLPQASHLWSLLTSTLDLLNTFLDIPADVVRDAPSAIFTYLAQAAVVLSTIARLPSTTAWDSVAAREKADFMNMGLRITRHFGDTLSKTGEDVRPEQKDVWRYFSRGIGGLMAWHQSCEARSAGEPQFELSISSSALNNVPLRCAIADMMTPFNTFRLRPSGPSQAGVVEGFGTREPLTTDTTGIHTGNRSETAPEVFNSIWDDETWQSIMDDFSTFPAMASFPVA